VPDEQVALLVEERAAAGRTRTGQKIGRNDACPCGSGKKYKKCCLGKASASP
jgi:uncharacterized protein YecA (UPF0149 family)